MNRQIIPPEFFKFYIMFLRGGYSSGFLKRALRPGTKHIKEFLGNLGALCKGKGAPLVRYLCTT